MVDSNNAQDEWESLRGIIKEILSAADTTGLKAHSNQNQAGTDMGMLLQRLVLAFKHNQNKMDNLQTFRSQFTNFLNSTLEKNDKSVLSCILTDHRSNLMDNPKLGGQDEVGSILDMFTGVLKPGPTPFNKKPF